MKRYRVTEINGDYAVLTDENGQPFEITVFLLPADLRLGETVVCENFEWFRPEQ